MKNINYLHLFLLAVLFLGLASCEKEVVETDRAVQTKKREYFIQAQEPCPDELSSDYLPFTPVCTSNFNWEVVGNWEVNIGVSPSCSDLTLLVYYADGTVVFEFDLYAGASNFLTLNPTLLQELLCGDHYIVIQDECYIYETSAIFSLGNC